MALTIEQEEIAKLQVRREKATRKLAIAKKPMNDKIRDEVGKATALVEAEYAEVLAPLVAEVANVEGQLKELCK